MALTAFQIALLRLLADSRKKNGISYIAGGVALNQALGTPRLSRDIDLFHDTTEALHATWASDRSLLERAGYAIELLREIPSFVEAYLRKEDDGVLVQWLRDSAFRFFPLVEDDLLGLTMHPLDLATNKMLALAGRLEPRDWVDMIACHRLLQPLGYLAWAACGKDPGINPVSLLADASRLRFAQAELDFLAFADSSPSAASLSRTWKEAIRTGKKIIDRLPDEHLGKCLLFPNGSPYDAETNTLEQDLKNGTVLFHPGAIYGAWPQLVTHSGPT